MNPTTDKLQRDADGCTYAEAFPSHQFEFIATVGAYEFWDVVRAAGPRRVVVAYLYDGVWCDRWASDFAKAGRYKNPLRGLEDARTFSCNYLALTE